MQKDVGEIMTLCQLHRLLAQHYEVGTMWKAEDNNIPALSWQKLQFQCGYLDILVDRLPWQPDLTFSCSIFSFAAARCSRIFTLSSSWVLCTSWALTSCNSLISERALSSGNNKMECEACTEKYLVDCTCGNIWQMPFLFVTSTLYCLELVL